MATTGRLRGTIHLPADKSIAHRALLFNAMGHGGARVQMHAPGEDVRTTAAALATLGLVEVDGDGETVAYRVTGGGTPKGARLPGTDEIRIDCGNSGTLMRLLAGAATTRPGRTVLTGDESLSSRPMERVAEPLRSIGASIATTDGHPPVVIDGGVTLQPGHHVLRVASAQVLGAIILASLPTPGLTEITVPGATRDHTERMLAWLGAHIVRDGYTTRLTGPAAWEPRDITVPADPSAAAFWLVAGTVHPDAEITIPHVGLNPTRLGVVRVLERMGAQIETRPSETHGPEPAGDLAVRSAGNLRAVDLGSDDVADVIDELPVLAVAMAAATGTSTVSGAGELRVKESDRIRLVVDGLQAMGVDATETADGWRITGGALRASLRSRQPHQDPAIIRTSGDHRIAMAFAIANLTGVGTRGAVVDDPACAAVSYPAFWQDLESLS
ncbi:MAG TPA: 3-phosphoshikimate 1-carboxyvinyltransferase [Actinomycetaceae bacterium]|nr:3-phosphoshikimate 1-carboxyvinyltransferase [Actinomycetaceae bacterium]